MADRGEKQLVLLPVENIDRTIITNPQTKFRSALKPLMGK
jgi:hypothetical protein